MISATQQYAYLNARIRARLSNLLTDELLERMIQAATLEEAVSMLQGTDYQDFYETYQSTGDLMHAEQITTQNKMREIAQLASGLSAQARSFMSALLMWQEIRFLKTALRVWFFREIGHKRTTGLFLQTGTMTIAYRIDYDALMAASTLNEIANQLEHTRYAKIILEFAPEVMRSRSIYALEVALDRFTLRYVHQMNQLLPATERVTIQRLFGVYIDMENIQFGKGLVLYGENNSAILTQEFLSGGTRLTAEVWVEAIQNDAFLKELLMGWDPQLDKAVAIQAPLSDVVQTAYDRLILQTGRQSLMQYPFSCAPMIAYFFFVDRDIRRLITLLNGKTYQVEVAILRQKILAKAHAVMDG